MRLLFNLHFVPPVAALSNRQDHTANMASDLQMAEYCLQETKERVEHYEAMREALEAKLASSEPCSFCVHNAQTSTIRSRPC